MDINNILVGQNKNSLTALTGNKSGENQSVIDSKDGVSFDIPVTEKNTDNNFVDKTGNNLPQAKEAAYQISDDDNINDDIVIANELELSEDLEINIDYEEETISTNIFIANNNEIDERELVLNYSFNTDSNNQLAVVDDDFIETEFNNAIEIDLNVETREGSKSKVVANPIITETQADANFVNPIVAPIEDNEIKLDSNTLVNDNSNFIADGLALDKRLSFDNNNIAISTTNQQNIETNKEINSEKLTTHLSPKLSSPNWQSAFNQHVSMLTRNGIDTAKIAINPPDLGPIDIEIQMENSSAKILFNATNLEVKNAIENSMDSLKILLGEQGVTLLDTQVNQNHKQSDSSTNYAHNGSYSRGDFFNEDEESKTNNIPIVNMISYYV